MQWKNDGKDFIIKIEKGEDVKKSIMEVVSSGQIKAGSVLWAVGMIQKMEIGYFNGKEYEKEIYDGPLEVVSFHGSIAENDPELHIHISVAGKDHSVVGGHLFSGLANPLLEVHLSRSEGFGMKRVYNPGSTLKELELY